MSEEQADDAEVCQDRIALEQYQEGIVDLGKREILDIGGRLLVRAEKAEAALAKEHENFLAVHRDNIVLANRNMELIKQLKAKDAFLAAYRIGKTPPAWAFAALTPRPDLESK